MLDYTCIEEVEFTFANRPKEIDEDCIGKGFTSDMIIKSIKIGDKYINTHERTEIIDYKYKLVDICNAVNPENELQFGLCLALYNSQESGFEAVDKYLLSHNMAPYEFSYLLNDTKGWLVWDYQFINILRLFTMDRDLPFTILNEYKRFGKSDSVPMDWIVGNESVIEVMEKCQFDRKKIYRLNLMQSRGVFKHFNKISHDTSFNVIYSLNEIRRLIDHPYIFKPVNFYNGIPIHLVLDENPLDGEIFKKGKVFIGDEKNNNFIIAAASNYGRVKIENKIMIQEKKNDHDYDYLIIKSNQYLPDVHRIIAQIWCEKPHGKNYGELEVHHINNNGFDNRPCNLIFVDHETHSAIHTLDPKSMKIDYTNYKYI